MLKFGRPRKTDLAAKKQIFDKIVTLKDKVRSKWLNHGLVEGFYLFLWYFTTV